MRIFLFVNEKIQKKKDLIILVGITIILGYYVGKNIVYQSPYIWLIFASIPVFFLVLKKYEVGIYLIMFTIFFADWLSGLGYIPPQISWIPEVVLMIYFVKFLVEKRSLVRTPIDLSIALFVVVGAISTILNSTSPISTILAFRLDLKFILMFYILVSINLEANTLKKMIGLLIFLLIIQIPVAYYKYTIYGQNEFSVGTYTYFGGALSTILPLFAISLFAGLSLYFEFRIKYILYIFGFLLFPIFAGKLGFLIFGSVLLLFLLWQIKGRSYRKFVPVGLVIAIGLFASILFVPRLNSILHNPDGLKKYAVRRTFRVDTQGSATGRMSAIQETFKVMKQDPIKFVVGWGPGSTIKSFFKRYTKKGTSLMPINISYGFSHLVSTVIDYGYMGFILYFIAPIILLFKVNKSYLLNNENKFWQAISFGFGGMIFSSLMIGLFYWELFRLDVSAFIFWFFAAVVCSVNSRKVIKNEAVNTEL